MNFVWFVDEPADNCRGSFHSPIRQREQSSEDPEDCESKDMKVSLYWMWQETGDQWNWLRKIKPVLCDSDQFGSYFR